MAHGKRFSNQDIDKIQIKCQKEAIQFVMDFYDKEHLPCVEDSLTIVWFAFMEGGWKCMVTSTFYRNHFFEITKRVNSGEICCSCYNRFEYIVHPSSEPAYFFMEPETRGMA